MDFVIYLIRHGKTLATEKNLYCGASDIDLTRKGKKEILTFKNKDIYPKCDAFFASELKRSINTLKLMYGDEIEYKAFSTLNEQNLGQLDMKSYDDIKNSPLYKAWLSDMTGDVKCPNGESLNQFRLRVKLGFHRLIEDIKSNDRKNAVLVTHGGVISVIMGSIFSNKKSYKEWQPLHGLGYTLHYDGKNFVNYSSINARTDFV